MLKRNLFVLYSLTVVALASMVICVFNYNPYQAHFYQFVIFYTSVFFCLAGIATLTIFYLKLGLTRKEVVYSVFWPSLRQSLFLAFGLTSLLVLKGLRLLDMWVAVPLVLIIIFLELFFQTKHRPV